MEPEELQSEGQPETVTGAIPEAAPSPDTVQPVVQPAAPPPIDMAPVRALLDERDRRQAAEREALELRTWKQEQERARQEAAAQAPNPVEDPVGFADWVQQTVRRTREEVTQEFQRENFEYRTELSRRSVEKALGDKVDDLYKFIDDAPDAMHAAAQRQADPYGWFHEQMLRRQKAQRAEELSKIVGDRSIDDIVAERIAAERAKWESEMQASQPGFDRPRGPDGKFAPSPSPSQTPRHQPPSLAAVNGASAPSGSDARGGYEAAFRK